MSDSSNTWSELSTRRGQLVEMAATLRNHAEPIRSVMADFPEEAAGSAWLERAIELIERAADEITSAACDLESEAVRPNLRNWRDHA